MLLKLDDRRIKMLILVFWGNHMVIQGERIYPLNVEKVVDNIFGNSQHAKRKESLANAALGVIKSASLIVHRIGLGLAAAKKLLGKHAVKQVDRLLSNPKLMVWSCFEKTVPYILGSRKDIVVAMDWTDFDADKQATLS